MEKAKVIRRSVFFGMLAVIVALAVVLAVVLVESRRISPLINSAEDLRTLNIVNQQLQAVLAPQLKGEAVLQLNERTIEREKFAGTFRFSDHRAFWAENKALRLQEVSANADFTVEGSDLKVENYRLTAGSAEVSSSGQSRFYQDFLIPYAEFSKSLATDGGIDLSVLAVDESKIGRDVQDQYQDYQADVVSRLNAFFGTSYTPDANAWRIELNGQYALVFSVDSTKDAAQNLAALAELDRTEGLNVTGIYYGEGQGPALCTPFREDDSITEELDPRQSLMVLAANQEIADMLLTSEFYGGETGFDFGSVLDGFWQNPRKSADPIGACVVVDEGRFLTPEMVEAISKVCYRCIDVKLLAAV